MKEVVIVSASRTAIGNFGGTLGSLSAVDIGVCAFEEAIKKSGINKNDVDDVIVGNVLGAGLGQNIARQIAINCGLSVESTAMTINKVCGSGLQAVILASQAILAGDSDIVVAGGTESMSNAPYVSNNARWGSKLGNSVTFDLILKDGLTDAFNNYHMGITAENLAEKYGITRQEQDEFALESQKRAEKAIKSGKFKDEIVPISIKQRKGEPLIFDTDEFPRASTTLEGLGKLRPAFKENGTVTAGNASGINDGAAALVLMSKEKAEQLGIKPLARIKSYASAGVEPSIMGYGVVPAVQKALKKANLNIEDIDLIESNEAFAVQSLAVAKGLNFDLSKVNVNGGAIALGHPIGASGARVLVSLLHEMQRQDAKRGLSTLCIGGGMGVSLIVERD